MWFAGCHKRSYANEGSVDHKMLGRMLDTPYLVNFLVGYVFGVGKISKVIWENYKLTSMSIVILFIVVYLSTVIPRLTKIIPSGITFVSRNVISRRFI